MDRLLEYQLKWATPCTPQQEESEPTMLILFQELSRRTDMILMLFTFKKSPLMILEVIESTYFGEFRVITLTVIFQSWVLDCTRQQDRTWDPTILLTTDFSSPKLRPLMAYIESACTWALQASSKGQLPTIFPHTPDYRFIATMIQQQWNYFVKMWVPLSIQGTGISFQEKPTLIQELVLLLADSEMFKLIPSYMMMPGLNYLFLFTHLWVQAILLPSTTVNSF